VAHARGVILQIAAARKIPIIEILPKDVKLKICGYGNAPKKQVQKMVQKLFELENLPRPDDAADALAIAFVTQKEISFKF
jgi:crossover junction endodeoxyribonuclease RuvC